MNIFNKKRVVTRFAPSPTGFLHIGGIRTALFAWAYARKHKGKFILRIEDTDKAREVEGSISHIIESLKWIGLDWDEGPDISGPNAPYKQSERKEYYNKYAKILIDKGMAYADPYTQDEIKFFRDKADQEKRPFLYRDNRPKNPPIWDGTHALRFKVSEIKNYEWNDLVRGDMKAGKEALDDFILIKSDGYPTYNFAHIVDDLEMGVTHIMRADEFISSIPKFLSLYEALGVKRPEFVTLPPIMGPDGKRKLGKRDGAKDFLEYQKEGYLPEAMMNFLAFIGWNPGDDKEIISKKEFLKLFNIEQIQISGGGFNEEKLNWVNREYIKLLSKDNRVKYISKFIPDSIKKLEGYNESILSKITPIILERISNGKDIIKMVSNNELNYFFNKPIYDKSKLFFKSSKIEESKKYEILSNYLNKSIELLSKIEINRFNKENIKNELWSYATEVGRGELLWPIRFSLSGLEKSPDPFILSEVLGKDETIARIKYAIQVLLKI